MAMTIIVLRSLVSSSYFPASWDTVQEDTGWVTLYPSGREADPETYLHACEMAVSGTSSLYVTCTPNHTMMEGLETLMSASSFSWTFDELLADNSEIATQLKAVWTTTESGSISFRCSMVGHSYSDNLLNND